MAGLYGRIEICMGDCMAGFKTRTRVGYYLPAVLLKISTTLLIQ
jgi:hypothetical protein